MATATRPAPLYRPATTQWSLPCGPLTGVEYGISTFTHPYSPTVSPGSASSCGPSGWYDSSRPSSSSRIVYMSPGICPSGYTVACSWYSTAQGPIPTSDEQAWNCLPTGYGCNSTRFAAHGANTVTNTVSDWAPMIAIRWASRDLSLLETHPLTPGLLFQASSTEASSATAKDESSAPTSKTSSSSTSTSTSTSTAVPAESGATALSAGSIAGIVVGVILGLALAAAAAFFVYKRRRQTPPTDTPHNGDIQPQVVPVAYKPNEKAHYAAVAQVHEIDSSRGPWGPVELPASSDPYTQAPAVTNQPYYNSYPESTAPSQNQSEYAFSSPSYAAHTVDGDADLPIPVSPSPAAVSETEADELERLRSRQSQLLAKRDRLLQLEEVAEEEERVLRRIEELERGGRA
ncbi:hypothetical protein B0T16DRAFT_244776 [Cercophora newfieldiana]|uniref:Uncharacterized protein n=1 Tax=Cercophora newfieldiana TaxID=92897 RepID=A0AA39XU52_9PEZI|nr:hypothetical protein B0T16DRAFT_244776 [Cercophora newfieldiana]